MPSIALTMIARDEAGNIARCLNSVAPYVDEMVVVDTVSSDATAEIARGCGAKVVLLDWPNNFSVARNFSLEQSACDYHLVLDADEWIVSGGENLRIVIAGKPCVGLVRRKNLMTIAGAMQASFTQIPRLLPKHVRYRGRIHEQPIHDFPCRDIGVLLAHSGFEGEALAKKRGRNESLLKLDLTEHPDDAYLHYQLGKEYQVAGRYAESAAAFAEALARHRGQEPWRHSLIVRAVYSFKMAERLEEAIALVDAEVHNWPVSPDFFFTVADLYLELAVRQPEKALPQHLPVAEYCWKKCLQIGERDDLDGSVLGRGSFMAAANLANFYETLGDRSNGARYRALEGELRARAA